MSLSRWIWKCPLEGCDSVSKKAVAHYKAKVLGRTHIKKLHRILDVDPIVEKVEIKGIL